MAKTQTVQGGVVIASGRQRVGLDPKRSFMIVVIYLDMGIHPLEIVVRKQKHYL